jgi:hypothetical protein
MKKIVYLVLALTFSCSGLQAAEMDTLRVYFDNGQTGISDFQQSLIDIFLETHFAQGQMIVAGHADDLGDNVTNLNQSRSRATMVAEYLLGKGVAPSQLLLQAWGETKPLVPNTNAINRTKNRRVEIIGLPYRTTNLDVIGLIPKPITLRNGLSLPYKEMTTQDGKPKQVFMIILRKGDPLEVEKVDSATFWTKFHCGFREDRAEIKCPERGTFQHKIEVAENFRCPLDHLVFKESQVNAAKYNSAEKDFVFATTPLDSSYYFLVSLTGTTECNSLDHGFGWDCYTVHPAKIIFEGLKVNYLRGKAAKMKANQTAKLQPDGSYRLEYTDENPANLKLFAQVVKGKRRKMGFRNVALDQLSFDPERGAYIVTPKDIKKLRKQ